MVPKGWEVKSFAKLLKSGDVEKIQDGNHGDSHPKSSDFVKSGIPFVMARDLKKGTVDLENCAYITKEQADSLRIGFAKTGDILLSHKGTVGLVAIVPLCDEYMMLTPQVTYYRIPQDSSLMSSYLYQFLLSHEYQSRFKNLAFQSTRSYLGITAQKELFINLPPLKEQQKIAKILSTWDKAISTTERLIDNSTQQKKALMQQLLTGKKRLLDDEGKRFEGEWEEVSVGSLGKIYSGGTPSTSNTEYWDGDINWITPTDITKQDSRYINSSLRKITLEGLENSSAKLVPAGSLLICTRATIGAMAITSHEMCTNQGFKNIVPNSKTNIEFVYYLLTYNKHRMINKASGSTFLELSKTSFESMKFKVPTLPEQQKIATVLTNADKEIELLDQQLADLQQEKKALMQVLLTGKKRVKLND